MLQLEEMSMNAWPAVQTMLYDGWVLRFAGGYTKRANSVNPVYASTLEINTKLDTCEAIFRRQKLLTTFKITPGSVPGDLDAILERRGYRVVDSTSVQTMELSDLPEMESKAIQLAEEPTGSWLEEYCRMNGVSAVNQPLLKKILGGIIPVKYFISLQKEKKTVACGMTVLENSFAGLFDIVVDPEYRGLGYGRQLVLNLLRIARSKGAKIAYLQVVTNNQPAVKLYESLGFREQYRYWYRVRD